jgi:DegV family protein with EDD domain
VIGLCTDSNAQLPPDLVTRYGIEVVPLTVVVDGVEHAEGVDLDADAFYARFTDGRTPQVSTAAPSPGAFAVVYERLAAAGATEIVSVHIGSEVSGTLNAARLGARSAPVPVRLVDTGAASFVVGCAVLAAAEALGPGSPAEVAATAAEEVAGRCHNVFVVGALDLARAGGRLAADVADADGIPVLCLVDGQMSRIGEVRSVDEAAAAMAGEILATAGSGRWRVGIAVADGSSRPIADELTRRLAGSAAELDLIEYRVGPSVGVHTGPGTAGAVYHPLG